MSPTIFWYTGLYCNAVSVPAPLDVLPVESLADSLNVETDPVRFSSVKFNSAGLRMFCNG